MTERPILFSAPMLRALLAGRKTQTRRVVKWPGQAEPDNVEAHEELPGEFAPWLNGERLHTIECPYGVLGDRLWVRETVACGACAPRKPSTWSPSFWRREQGTPANPNGLWYAADRLEPERPITERGRWVPGIHMPRWASRLTLAVTDIRVERLQAISAADAHAEGCDPVHMQPGGPTGDPSDGWLDYREGYRSLWETINGKGSWDANPWVWAVTFDVEARP